jgi:hypothetical protein
MKSFAIGPSLVTTPPEQLWWVCWQAPDDAWYFVRDRHDPGIWLITKTQPAPVSRLEASEVRSMVARHISPAPVLVPAPSGSVLNPVQ